MNLPEPPGQDAYERGKRLLDEQREARERDAARIRGESYRSNLGYQQPAGRNPNMQYSSPFARPSGGRRTTGVPSKSLQDEWKKDREDALKAAAAKARREERQRARGQKE